MGQDKRTSAALLPLQLELLVGLAFGAGLDAAVRQAHGLIAQHGGIGALADWPGFQDSALGGTDDARPASPPPCLVGESGPLGCRTGRIGPEPAWWRRWRWDMACGAPGAYGGGCSRLL